MIEYALDRLHDPVGIVVAVDQTIGEIDLAGQPLPVLLTYARVSRAKPARGQSAIVPVRLSASTSNFGA